MTPLVAMFFICFAPQAWDFSDVTADVGLDVQHGWVGGVITEQQSISAGVAAGDLDRDGYVDLYYVGGDAHPNHLFRNQAGLFVDVTAGSGLELAGQPLSGPIFGDLNGDGYLDLVVGGVFASPPQVFLNNGDFTFSDHTAATMIQVTGDTMGGAMGDYDRDGDLDLFLAHWGSLHSDNRLWQNNGAAVFTPVDASAGIPQGPGYDYSFTPNFSDINGDGWLDILVAADFNHSEILINQGDGTFVETTNAVISDENGMGAAVGDFDNDGDMDWFVSSIWDPDGIPNGNWGITGNRLYRNQGDGTFEDVTDLAGVRRGYWGWGSSFQDFNNDGWLDIFHVNGFHSPMAVEFHLDPARLFVSRGGSHFVEESALRGVDDTGQGRGIVCFDYDRDGDVDIFIHNNSGHARMLRNNGAGNHFLGVHLIDDGANPHAVGARVEVLTADGLTQIREIRAGSHFVSQDPPEAHFGLGSHTRVEQLRVTWPDGGRWSTNQVPADQWLTIERGAPAPVPTLSPFRFLLLTLLIATVGIHLIHHKRKKSH